MPDSPDPRAPPFVPYVADRERGYPASLQGLLDGIRARMGLVANSIALYLHRPAIAEAALRFNAAVQLDAESTLPRLLKRKLALICSATNGCAYCTAHQCSYLGAPQGDGTEHWGLCEDELVALATGTLEPADEFERVCFDFARAASRDPGGVTDALRARLREQLSPAQIIELAFVIGHWKLFNTVHDSLKVPIEPANLRYRDFIEQNMKAPMTRSL